MSELSRAVKNKLKDSPLPSPQKWLELKAKSGQPLEEGEFTIDLPLENRQLDDPKTWETVDQMIERQIMFYGMKLIDIGLCDSPCFGPRRPLDPEAVIQLSMRFNKRGACETGTI